MPLEVDETLLTSFDEMLSSPAPANRQKEQTVQDFLEENSVLIPTPNLLNHGLHFHAVISKFRICPEYITDYIYVSKSSGEWRITFVELESPDKEIFTKNKKQVRYNGEFMSALYQVRDWRLYIDNNRNEVLNRIRPLLKPLAMATNPIEFHYQLIIGRSKEKNNSSSRLNSLHILKKEHGVDVLTYDTLMNYYRHSWLFEKNILRMTAGQFTFKRLHREPSAIFAHMTPEQFSINAAHSIWLKKRGFEIDKWLDGNLLVGNGKYADDDLDDETFIKRMVRISSTTVKS